MRLYLLYLVFSLMPLLYSGLTAQPPLGYKFEALNVNDGLSHGQVNCIFKDSRGYIWIGTSAGLNLYNGYTVQTFTYDPRVKTSLNAADIEGIFEGPDGNIWISTYRGLNIYHPLTGKISHNVSDFVKKYELPNASVEKILASGDGIYWFLNADAGISRYSAKSQKTTRFTTAGKNAISSNNVSAIAKNSEGDIWLVHTNGIIEKIDSNTGKVKEVDNQLASFLQEENLVYDVMVDSDDDLWIYLPFTASGIFYYDVQSKKLENYSKTSSPIALNADLVKGVTEDVDGNIWVGTDHGGINIIDKKKQFVSYLLHDPGIENSLSHNSVYSLYKDDDGIIWVGTYKNGVNYYHKNIRRFAHYKHSPSVPGSLPFDDINRFAEDRYGNIWIGTNGGGLLYFNRSENSFTQYKSHPGSAGCISSDVVVSLLIDRKNNLWVGTYFGGLNRYNESGFRQYKPNIKNKSGQIPGDNIWELFEDSEGNIWVGTLSNGLNRYIPETDEFEHYALSETGSDSTLHIGYILAMEEDDEGNIWLGGGAGVDIIEHGTWKIKQFKDSPDSSFILQNNIVTSLYKDHEGRMWIGTQEGLYVYDQKGNMLKGFTEKDGLPHNSILTILEDDNHNFWFSTPNGLSTLSPGPDGVLLDGHFVNYGERDGLQGQVFNENAALKTRKGELLFGGANGFNLFNPSEFDYNLEVPEIVFTDFKLFNESLEAGEEQNGRKLLSHSAANTRKITLNHDENVFSIEFAALNYLHPEKNSYQYKLEGFDNHWRTADNTREVTYTNLDPGNYTFRVMASNNDGVWNNEGIELIISVLPPFWKTSWAYVFYALLLIGMLYTGRRIMLQRERVKFQLEQERREARQRHELDLLKIRFFTNISHEFRTPLSLILAPLDKLGKHITNDDQATQFSMISRNAKRLLNLVNQLLDFRKLEVDTIEFHASEGNVIKFIKESVHSFSDLSENKNVSLNFSANMESLFVWFDMDKLEKILFNLLSNAFKFTPENGQIDVDVECSEMASENNSKSLLQIKIRDTGIGISPDKQKNIFDRFFRDETPNSLLNQGSGIGLSLTLQFVKMYGGTIEVESQPGEGSCFTVCLPVKNTASQQLPVSDTLIADIPISKMPRKTVPNLLHDKDTPVVLLVEDNEDFRFYLKDNLGVHFKIIDAKNGKEGWQMALSSLPDLIVSDVMMPELNGLEFCEKIKQDKRTSHIPFVLLTAATTDEQKLKGLHIGADDYITKPFNFEILMSRVKNLICQRQAMQETYQKRISVETSEVEIISLDDKLIQKAIKIVEENLTNPDLSVEMLSRELGMSRVHLYKKMVSLTGSSPVEFIRKIRLQRAAQFLRKSQLTVAEVAYMVGFNNRKYFTKYFKMEYNILPSVYASQYAD